MIIKNYIKILLIFCLFFGAKTRVSALDCNCDGIGCDLTGVMTSCTNSTTIGICAMNGAGTCGSVCGSTTSDCCSYATTYSKYTWEIVLTKTRTCDKDGVCTTPVPSCNCSWKLVASACLTGDKCLSGETFLRAGTCTCTYRGGKYKLCCSNTVGTGPVACTTSGVTQDGLGDPEGRCPDGSTTILIPEWARTSPDIINQAWIDSVCSSCTAVNGSCGTADGTCAAGTVSDSGATSTVGGITYSLWSCLGTCGGANASCSYQTCSTVNGVCGSAETGSSCTAPTSSLCTSGTASSVTTNSTTFTWTCTGSCGGGNDSCVKTRSIVNGQCGSSDGSCVEGTAVDSGASNTVANDGIYSLWSCNSACNGTNASCSYKTCSSVAGLCSTSDGACLNGTTVVDVGATSVTANVGIYSLWTCNGICASTSNASCSYKTCSSVNGVCGAAAGTSTCNPPTTNLCTTTYGNTAVSTNTSTNIFSWSCNPDCAGTASNCTSTRLVINGVCGTADGGNFVSTPTTNLCSVGTASAVTLSGTTYSWSCNASCNGTTDYCSAVYDTAPSLSSTVLKNTSGTVIATEVGGRNHSCDANFSSKTNVWTITGSDANGLADIKETSLRFRSVANTYSYGPVAAVNGVASFTIDTTSFTPGTYNVETLINDIHDPPLNRDWIDTNRDFKIWDCQVNIGGTIFDSSDDQFFTCNSSNNIGFGVTISPGLSFPLAYGNTVDESRINMTVNSPYFTGTKPTNSLTWQTEYWLDTLDIDTAIPGVLKAFKIDGNCVLPWNSHFNLKDYVDPYATTPRADFKYSAVMDQDAWFRVVNGGVLTRNSVTNLVPVTCLDNCNTSTQGLVWSKNITLSDWDDSPVSETTPLRPISYDYGNLKYDIYGGKEVGTTIVATSTSWSSIKDTANGVIFVSGNLVIDENVNPADHVFFIVKGNITIEETVTNVRGMFFADGAITASGENDTKLSISGSIYSKAGITLDRTYTTKRNNNNNPAVEVTYDPNLIFKLHPRLWYTYENWKME